ncbi:hypothetical protein ABG067_003125 [Albugo candida]
MELTVRSVGDNSNKAQGEQVEPPRDLSIRCMFTYNRNKDAVCRECLALHSKSLAIGTFHIYLVARKKPIAELHVFSSTYPSRYIMRMCQIRFCPAIEFLDSADCQKLHTFFPSVRLFMKSQVDPDYSSQNPNDNYIRITTNGLDPDAISRISNQVASRRMSRFRQKNEFTKINKQRLMDALRILTGKEPKCVMVTSLYNRLHLCISWALEYKRDVARVIIDFSLTSATIVTDGTPSLDCLGYCNHIDVLKEEPCSNYLQEHAMDIESHHCLLESPYSDPLMSSCMLLYHTASNKHECAWCVRKIFKVGEEPHSTTAFSSLLDASDTSLEITSKFFGVKRACHTKNHCSRIQQVPNRFCSEHRAYVGMTSDAQETRKSTISSIHQLTKAKMSVGVWPPSSKNAVENEGKGGSSLSRLTPLVTQTETSIWPSYCKIALVEFTSAPSEQLQCVGCLIHHSEVFFVHTTDDGYSGKEKQKKQ